MSLLMDNPLRHAASKYYSNENLQRSKNVPQDFSEAALIPHAPALGLRGLDYLPSDKSRRECEGCLS